MKSIRGTEKMLLFRPKSILFSVIIVVLYTNFGEKRDFWGQKYTLYTFGEKYTGNGKNPHFSTQKYTVSPPRAIAQNQA